MCKRNYARSIALSIAFTCFTWNAHATTFTVTNLNDSGSGSLRQALHNADFTANNNSVVNDLIVFAPSLSGTIQLSSQIHMQNGVEIRGPGASIITISGLGNTRLFVFDRYDPFTPFGPLPSQTYTISGLTLADGQASLNDGSQLPGSGGAIQFPESIHDGHHDTLQISDCVFRNNQSAAVGGAIVALDGNVNLTDVTFQANHAQNTHNGGAVYLQNTTTVATKLLFTGNTAYLGGAGAIIGGTADVSVATFNNNHAYQGAGLQVSDATATVTNSAFLANGSSGGLGVAIAAVGSAVAGDTTRLNLIHNTIAGNLVDPGVTTGTTIVEVAAPVSNAFCDVYLMNNFFDNHWASVDEDTSGRAHSHTLGGNLSNYDPQRKLTSSNDVINAVTGLSTTIINGLSPAFSYVVAPSSPGVNIGTTGCVSGVCIPPTDFRGLPRIEGALPDAGVYEVFNATLEVYKSTTVFDGTTKLADGAGFDFGISNLNTPISQTFTIISKGTSTLTLQSLSLPPGFSVVSPFGSPSLTQNQSTTFTIRFDAASAGVFSGPMVIANNSNSDQSFTINLSGRVNAVDISVADNTSGSVLTSGVSSVDFGKTIAGSSLSRTFTITNPGGVPLTIGGTTLPTGFTLTQAPAAQVLGGASTTFAVRFDAAGGAPGTTATGNVTIADNVPPKNPFVFAITARLRALPHAHDDFYTLPEGLISFVDAAHGLLANDTNPEGGVLTAQLVTGPSQGTLTLSADGSFRFVAPSGFTATTTFTYQVFDSLQLSAAAIVVLVIDPVPNGPEIDVTTTSSVIDAAASCSAVTVASLPGPDGQVSLAEAICAANSNPDTNLIEIMPAAATKQQFQFSTPNNYWYGPNALPPISSPIIIDGRGAVLQVTGGSIMRFFYISGGQSGLASGSLELRDITLRDAAERGGSGGSGTTSGAGGGGGMGGAIFNQGVLTLNRVTLVNNTATGGAGGGIFLQNYFPGGGGMFGNGSAGVNNYGRGSGGGGGFRTNGGRNAGGDFDGTEGGRGTSGGTSVHGGNGGNGNATSGGGGGGYSTGDNGGAPAAGNGGGAGGQGGASSNGGGGGAFGGGGSGGTGNGGPDLGAAGGGGGVGGGGGGGATGLDGASPWAGNGGFGGGGGGSQGGHGGDGGFGGGGGGCYGSCTNGVAGFGAGKGGHGGNGQGAGSGGGGAGFGGAIFNDRAILRAVNSTFSSNHAQGGASQFSNGANAVTADPGNGLGGAIFNRDGTVELTHVTLASNSAVGGSIPFGSPIASDGASIFNLQLGNASLTLRNSLLAAGTGASSECRSAQLDGTTSTTNVSLQGTNLISANSGCGSVASNSVQVVPLADNGGLTPTHALPLTAPANAAVDSADATVCTTYAPFDQRGESRPRDGDGNGSAICDVGAFETDPPYDVTVSKTGPVSVTRGTTATFMIRIHNSGPGPARNIEVTDPTPSAVHFVSATTPCAGGFPCLIGDLLRGEDFIITATYSVPFTASGSFSNIATVAADLPAYDSSPANNTSTASVQTVAPAPAPTTTTVGTNQTPARFGEPVTFTAAVAGGTSTPTGPVVFNIDSGALPAVQLVAGVASLTTGTLTVGTHTVSASFAGDGTTLGQSSGVLAGDQLIIKADTTTTLASSVNPIVTGQSTTFTATVASLPPGSGTPTGTVTFTVDGTTAGTSPLNTGIASLTYSMPLSADSHVVTATYNGDGNFNSSIGPLPIPQQSNPSDTSVNVVSSANPSIAANSVTFTATVSSTPPGTGLPSGTVDFVVDGTTAGTVTMDGLGVASFSKTFTKGTYAVQAVYSGEPRYFTSTGTLAGGQLVGGETSSTTLNASPNPAVFGQAVTLIATIGGSVTPTGSVSFVIDGTTVSTQTLAGGTASFTIATLSTGSHGASASYSGDPLFATSTGSLIGGIVVNPAATATSIVTSKAATVFGEPVTFTASVAAVPPGSGTPAGNVSFVIDGGSAVSVSLSGGNASMTPGALAVGTHTVTATYAGNVNFSMSAGALAPLQTVAQAITSTTVATSGTPSSLGSSITFTAMITPVAPGIGAPGGTANFVIDGGAPSTAPATNGQASLSTSSLAAGSHTVAVSYSGDTNFLPSAGSLIGGQVVNRFAAALQLTTSADPSIFGQQVTFSAHVTPVPPANGTPTGGADFTIDGATVASNVPLDLSQNAQYSTTTLTPGTHSVTAFYRGDSSFGSAASAAITQTVNPGIATSISIVSGDHQTAVTNTAFTDPLRVVVREAGGNPVPNASVSFSSPASGPSAAVGTHAMTDLNGEAFVQATANHLAGTYAVVSSIGPLSTSFHLTNASGPPATLALLAGSSQVGKISEQYVSPLSVRVVDVFGNPVGGVTVNFVVSSTGAAGGVLSPSPVITDSDGVGRVFVTANSTVGSFVVTASMPGVASEAIFHLTNAFDIPTLQTWMLMLLAAMLLGAGAFLLRE